MRIALVIFILLFSMSGHAAGTGAVVLKTFAHLDSEPKFIKKEDATDSKKATGLCVDIFNHIEKIANVKFTGKDVFAPISRIEKSLENNFINIACGFVYNERRAEKFIISEPFMAMPYIFIAKKDDPLTEINPQILKKINQDNDRILAVYNWGNLEPLKKLMVNVDAESTNIEQAVKRLAAGRARFVFYRKIGVNHELRKFSLSDKLKVLGGAVINDHWHFLFPKQTPASVVKTINDAIVTMKADGSMQAIEKKWSDY